MYGRVTRFAVDVTVVVRLGAAFGNTVVDNVAGTEAADDDGPVCAIGAVLGVACCVSEQPTEIIAMTVNPKHTERTPTPTRLPGSGFPRQARSKVQNNGCLVL